MRIDTRAIASFALAAATMLLLVFLCHSLNLVSPPPPAPDSSSFLYQVASIPFLIALVIVASALGTLLLRPIPIGLGMISPLAVALVLDLSRRPTSPPEVWDTTLATHLDATFLLSKYAAASMVKRKRGKIINLASMYSFFGAEMTAIAREQPDYAEFNKMILARTPRGSMG